MLLGEHYSALHYELSLHQELGHMIPGASSEQKDSFEGEYVQGLLGS